MTTMKRTFPIPALLIALTGTLGRIHGVAGGEIGGGILGLVDSADLGVLRGTVVSLEGIRSICLKTALSWRAPSPTPTAIASRALAM